jgi:coenzyme F420-reducing hydrogenase alpha subunit
MTEQPPSRFSIDRQEFEAFLAENQQLVERLEKLFEKMDALESLNKSLEEKLRAKEQKLDLTAGKGGVGLQEADEALLCAKAAQ